MKFSIRTLLIGISTVALLVSGFLWMQWRSRWQGVREELSLWATGVDRTDGKIEQYVRLISTLDPQKGFTGSHSFTVLTGEPLEIVLQDGSKDWTTVPELSEDPSRFFVIPPGIWVDDIEGVISIWDRHYEEGLQAP